MPPLTFEPYGSHIKHLAYDPDSLDLSVTFQDNRTYTHSKVPPHVFTAMTRHPSTGKYYHNVIRRHYRLTNKSAKKGNEKQVNDGSSQTS
jgi:hypothetical protein